VVLARVGDAIRVVLATERDGVLRPVEEGGRGLLHSEDFMKDRDGEPERAE
jgi:hypothetical protein